METRRSNHGMRGRKGKPAPGGLVGFSVFGTGFVEDRILRQEDQQGQARERCRECGFRVRGPNHKHGTHHGHKHPSLKGK